MELTVQVADGDLWALATNAQKKQALRALISAAMLPLTPDTSATEGTPPFEENLSA